MSNVEQVESQVRGLNADELRAFRDWFAQFDAEAWDQQIEARLEERCTEFIGRPRRRGPCSGSLDDFVIHHAAADFWRCYRSLPTQIRDGADRAFALVRRPRNRPLSVPHSSPPRATGVPHNGTPASVALTPG